MFFHFSSFSNHTGEQGSSIITQNGVEIIQQNAKKSRTLTFNQLFNQLTQITILMI